MRCPEADGHLWGYLSFWVNEEVWVRVGGSNTMALSSFFSPLPSKLCKYSPNFAILMLSWLALALLRSHPSLSLISNLSKPLTSLAELSSCSTTIQWFASLALSCERMALNSKKIAELCEDLDARSFSLPWKQIRRKEFCSIEGEYLAWNWSHNKNLVHAAQTRGCFRILSLRGYLVPEFNPGIL